jgi:hypothetical protein
MRAPAALALAAAFAALGCGVPDIVLVPDDAGMDATFADDGGGESAVGDADTDAAADGGAPACVDGAPAPAGAVCCDTNGSPCWGCNAPRCAKCVSQCDGGGCCVTSGGNVLCSTGPC